MKKTAKIVILTGAGISAESGISTFRDSNGLWNNHDVKDVCNFDSLAKNEALTLEFYNQRRLDLKNKEPNYAHTIIAELKKKYPDEIVVITQNVDSLFEKAGLSSKEIIHLHGFLTELRCTKCSNIIDIGYEIQNKSSNYHCDKCGNKLRPNIVFFGEEAPNYELLNYYIHHCELLVVIGTSGNVLEINSMAESVENAILNNLEHTWMINEENFSKVLYKKVTLAIDEIKEDIEKFLTQKSTITKKTDKMKSLTKIELAQQVIDEAEAILITAGAGMGVDSGLPDFRGNEGLWTAYPPVKRLGLDFKQMESSSLFRSNSKLAWGFYGHRINLYRDTEPNAGFQILKEIVSKKNDNYFIFTSNVDGHFQKAGFPEEKIYEIHGSIDYIQCVENCEDKIYPNELENFNVDMDKLEVQNYPLCKKCKSTMMPNILMFGNGVFHEKRVQAQNERFKEWLASNKGKRMVIIEIGAGRTIPTLRTFDDNYSNKNDNVKLIRINPQENEVWNDLDIGINGKGLDIIKKLCKGISKND